MPVFGLKFRLTEGFSLSSQQGDENLRILRDAHNALEQLMGVVLKPNGTLKDWAVGATSVLADGIVTAAKLAADAKLPAGVILAFGGSTVPDGWFACDGATKSRTDYAALFTAIGITHGVGDGSTTFTLPDYRRRALIGDGGSGSSVIGNAVGNTGGSETHTLTEEELVPHTHDITFDTMLLDGGPNESADLRSTPIPTGEATVTSESTGDGDAFNIIQPSSLVKWIIKY